MPVINFLSQFQIYLSCPCFVKPELDPVNISPLPAGTMWGFVDRSCRRKTARRQWQEDTSFWVPVPLFLGSKEAALTDQLQPQAWPHEQLHTVAVSTATLTMASDICLTSHGHVYRSTRRAVCTVSLLPVAGFSSSGHMTSKEI